MTLRFGSIVIHKPDPNSETDNNSNASSDEAELAEVAEAATVKYNNKKHGIVRRLERQKRTMTKSRSLESRRSSVSSSESNGELSILRIMNRQDRSPPLLRSHYYSRQAEERLQNGKEVTSQRNQRKTSANNVQEVNGERLGFRVLATGSRTTDKAVVRRHTSVIPDITSSFTTPFVPIIDDAAAINGLVKLLKNLNFPEKIRQQRAEQQRLDIQKLPQHMRDQLKHIYVY